MMELHPASIINFIPIGLIKGFSGVDYLSRRNINYYYP